MVISDYRYKGLIDFFLSKFFVISLALWFGKLLRILPRHVWANLLCSLSWSNYVILLTVFLPTLTVLFSQVLLVTSSLTEASSTLHRFQTKTILFCSVFEKICVHTNRFRFRPSTLERVSVLKTLLNFKFFYNLLLDSFAITFLATN